MFFHHIGGLFFQITSNLLIHLGLSYTQQLYAKSENFRVGNDQILNGLQEGLFVIDETNGKMRFLYEAGKIIIKNDYLTSNA